MMKNFKTLNNETLVTVIGGNSQQDFQLGRAVARVVKRVLRGGK